MIRFGFSIKTRTGQRVENISIMAGSQSDAVPRRVDTLDVEGVIGLIANSEPAMMLAAANDAPATVIRLRNKAGTH